MSNPLSLIVESSKPLRWEALRSSPTVVQLQAPSERYPWCYLGNTMWDQEKDLITLVFVSDTPKVKASKTIVHPKDVFALFMSRVMEVIIENGLDFVGTPLYDEDTSTLAWGKTYGGASEATEEHFETKLRILFREMEMAIPLLDLLTLGEIMPDKRTCHTILGANIYGLRQ